MTEIRDKIELNTKERIKSEGVNIDFDSKLFKSIIDIQIRMEMESNDKNSLPSDANYDMRWKNFMYGWKLKLFPYRFDPQNKNKNL